MDGDITSSIELDGTEDMDTGTPGGYYIFYICEDSAGNHAPTGIVYVVVGP